MTSPDSIVAPFSHDVRTAGRYLYAGGEGFSTRVATRLQTEAIVDIIRARHPGARHILDVGCGDGTYTVELARRLSPASVVGFDPSAPAIAHARASVPPALKRKLSYAVASIARTARFTADGAFDCAVVRGVLHHITDPRPALRTLSRSVDAVVILEPSGYNPILKIIEKTSPYHIRHGEKSYWPPSLLSWIRDAGFDVGYVRIFSSIPYFCPEPIAKILWLVNPVIEAVPVIRELLCGTIVIYATKRHVPSGMKPASRRRSGPAKRRPTRRTAPAGIHR